MKQYKNSYLVIEFFCERFIRKYINARLKSTLNDTLTNATLIGN